MVMVLVLAWVPASHAYAYEAYCCRIYCCLDVVDDGVLAIEGAEHGHCGG